MTPDIEHEISLAEALELVDRLTDQRDAINVPGTNISISETFNKSAITTILEQAATIKLRIYFGMEENGQVVLILVGVNNSGEDIIRSRGNVTDNPAIMERGQKNP